MPCKAASRLKVSLFDVHSPVEWALDSSKEEAKIIIWAVYRRILAGVG